MFFKSAFEVIKAFNTHHCDKTELQLHYANRKTAEGRPPKAVHHGAVRATLPANALT